MPPTFWRSVQPRTPPAVERAIADELQRLGVKRPLVTFRVVNRLERERTGKMRRFVPLHSIHASIASAFSITT